MRAVSVGLDAPVEKIALVGVRLRVRIEALIAPAEETEPLRRRPRQRNSSSSFAIASMGFPELASAKA